MIDTTDGYIRQAIKNWAAEQQPAANGRARLLLVAASPPAQRAQYEHQKTASLDFNALVYAENDLHNLPIILAVQLTFSTLRRVT